MPIGKTVALIQVPNQRLFSLRAAAQYLGVDPDTLREDSDAGHVPVFMFHGRRTFKLDDLDLFIESLPRWENRARPIPASATQSERTTGTYVGR